MLPWQHGLKMVRTRPFHGNDVLPHLVGGSLLKFEITNPYQNRSAVTGYANTCPTAVLLQRETASHSLEKGDEDDFVYNPHGPPVRRVRHAV